MYDALTIRRLALSAALVVTLLFQPRVDGANEIFYVDNTQGDCTDAGPGTSFSTPFCSPVAAAAATTTAGQRVEVTSSLYRLSAFGAGTTTSLAETTAGVTWIGMGDSPDDVRIVHSRSTTVDGVTITKTAGRTNVWQFTPPGTITRIGAIGELGRWSDVSRRNPGAYSGIEYAQDDGIFGYFGMHNRNLGDLGDIYTKWRNTSLSVSGTTITITSTNQMIDTFSQYMVGKRIKIAGNYYTITAVASSTSATIDTDLGTLTATEVGQALVDLWATPCATDAVCEPPDIASCVEALDSAEGAWCQDDTDYGSTWVVYFHPRRHHRLASLTSVGTTATGTCARYCNYVTGDSVIITGATPSAYNGTYTITITGTQETSQTFTYTFAGASGAPATGSVEAIPNGATLNMEFVVPGGGPTCSFYRDNTTLSNITCVAFGSGSDRGISTQSGTAFAMEVGGDNSHIHDIWAIGGQSYALRVESNLGGLNDFVLEDFKAFGGMQGDTGAALNQQVALGFTIRDGELSQGINGSFAWGGPWGTDNAANAALFTRLNIRESQARRFRRTGGCASSSHFYDWAEDPVNTRYTGGSRWHVLGTSSNALECNREVTEQHSIDDKTVFEVHAHSAQNLKYANFYNNIFVCFSDAINATGASTVAPTTTGSVRFWNNTFRCSAIETTAPQHDNLFSLWNNFYFGLNIPIDLAEIESSGHNYVWGWRDACPVYLQGGLTLAQAQTVGTQANKTIELNSQITCTITSANLNTIFTNGTIATGTTTGGENFRPVSGSVLIDAGEDSHCGYTPTDGECDIGAFEFGDENATGPPTTTERILIAGTTGGDPAPSNTAPTVDVGVDLSITLPNAANLSGSVIDNGTTTVAWTQQSGPSSPTGVDFSSSTSLTTVATFTGGAGTYVIRLTATDTGALTGFDELTVTVTDGTPPPNNEPSANLGPDILLDAGDFDVVMDAQVADDGLPTPPGATTLLWELKGAPPGIVACGSQPCVTFSSTSTANPTVSFPQPGTYRLRLNVTDGAATVCDDVDVTVQSGGLPSPTTGKRIRLRIKL